MLSARLVGPAIPGIIFGAMLDYSTSRAATETIVSASSDDALAEITVSAERRSESLEKVPMSLTAFSNKDLEELHIQSFSDLQNVVPGLVLSTTYSTFQSQNDIAIRGIFSGGNSPTTAVYIDETPITIRRIDLAAGSGSPSPDIFDLDRIEVLRGPQGTLFGSSAMGGAIRYITPQPSLDKSSGYTKAEVGITNSGAPSYAVGVAYGAPIVSGAIGFRISGWYHTDGGYVDIQDPYTGKFVKRNANTSDTYVLRPAITFSPTEALTITPAAFIQHFHSQAPSTYWLSFIPHPEAGGFVAGDLVPQPQTDNLNVYSVAVKYEMSAAEFQSDTSYLNRKYDGDDDWTHWWAPMFGGGPFDLAKSAFSSYDLNLIDTKAWQQEFRFSSKDSNSRFGWVAGLYYRHATQISSQLIPPNLDPLTEKLFGQTSLQYFGVPDFIYRGQVLNSYTYYSTLDVSKAVFGEATFELVPRLKANIGVRVEHAQVLNQHQINAGPLLGSTYSDVYAPDQNANPVTPRAGLTYQYTDEDMAYLSVSKGYRSGGGNAGDATHNPLCSPDAHAYGLTTVPPAYNSDSLWSYELGAKNSFFDRRLTTQASVFYDQWSNIQTPLYLFNCAETVTVNRNKAVTQGFDLQIAAVPFQGMKLLFNVGYTDAHFANASYGALTNGVLPLLNGAGDKLAGVVPWSASLHADYSLSIGDWWTDGQGYIRSDYRWLDATPKWNTATVSYDPAIGSVPNAAYGTLNIRVGARNGRLDVSAFINNATNSNPRLGYSHVVPADPLYEAVAIRPLTVGLTTFFQF
jgi:outer membrane receptor protein involved in Fe transport